MIHLPGKSAGEIGLYFDPAHHAISREMGGILLLGDAIVGNPPGALSLIPELKLDDPSKLKRSLRKLLDYDFDVLLLCDGQPVLKRRQTESRRVFEYARLNPEDLSLRPKSNRNGRGRMPPPVGRTWTRRLFYFRVVG